MKEEGTRAFQGQYFGSKYAEAGLFFRGTGDLISDQWCNEVIIWMQI
jgi:hypothetical protein